MPISQPRILNETLSRKAAIATGTATIVKNISKIKNEIVNIIVTPTCPLSPEYKFKVTQAGADCQPSCFYYPRHNIRLHHDIVPANLHVLTFWVKLLKRLSKKHIPIAIVNEVVSKAPPLTSWITIPRKTTKKV